MADRSSRPVRTHFESKMVPPAASNSSSASNSPTKSKVIRSQRITVATSPATIKKIVEEEDPADWAPPIRRSHTPGHLASKSQSASRRMASESSIRSRSQSASQAAGISGSKATAPPALSTNTFTPASASRLMPGSGGNNNTEAEVARPPLEKRDSTATDVSRDTTVTTSTTTVPASNNVSSSNVRSTQQLEVRRPTGMRSTSAIASKSTGGVSVTAAGHNRQTSASATVSNRGSGGGHSHGHSHSHHHGSKRDPYIAFPPLQDPRTASDVPHAPSSGMYWSRAPVSGAGHTALRAHTVTLVGSNVFVFGGCDSRACFNELYVLDADSFHWSSPHIVGDTPVPLRAMTCTAVGKKLVIFGGGDGPAYYNEVYVLDTTNFRWTKPRIVGDRQPSKRRAHTACLYKNGIYVFGGGDGVRALNDVWRLDVTDTNKMSWKFVSGPPSSSSSNGGKLPADMNGKDVPRPKARGYHTANMVGSKLIIFGGSDGGECFNDVWVYDVDTNRWSPVSIPVTHRRLSHTATIVGSYLFVIGGHDGNEYSNDVLLLNLVTMTWDKRKVYGLPPSGRGYHGAVLYDSRILVTGGFDGSEVFRDVWILELAVHSYYSQISHFTIEV
ncbi:putative rab9 effector protein with kelch motifs protein [Zalerion maritima]|uniref:Rab9 effector protein with kelch motifs protein n=1 Tax=Zalerion maritima TaxID=339359 RepID=A0AAD5RG13_9PEZI|nr:putative rab9 effector protein with kelch motifs protein [Zalerion maritima]